MPVKSTKLNEAVIPTGHTFNRFVEASNRVLDGPGMTTTKRGRVFRQEVLVRNLTNSDIGFNKIIGIGDLRFRTGENLFGMIDNPCFDSITTQTLDTEHFGQWGITSHPIRAFESGMVIVGGITACEVNVTDEDHLYADVFNSTDGKDRLTSATTGHAKIVNRDTGTGNRNCVVFIGQNAGRLYGVLDGALSSGGTQTISNPTCTVHGDWIGATLELSTGAKVGCDFIPVSGTNRWVVTSANACEV